MPSKSTFTLKALREAVAARVDETSIRAVAEEIGMSPSGLHVLLSGSKPHPATRAKLVAWYMECRQNVGRKMISALDVDAALRLLVHYVRQDARLEVRERRAREIVRRFKRDADVDLED